LPNGRYERIVPRGKKFRAQEKFYTDAVKASVSARHIQTRFRPLSRPEKQ
jgi:hypothetical protein